MTAASLIPAVHMANLGVVHGWFDEAGLRHPTDEACFDLARKLQVAINRSNNKVQESLAGEDLPVLELADVDHAEIVAQKWRSTFEAAQNLAFHLERFLEYSSGLTEQEREGFTKLEGVMYFYEARF